MYKTKKELDAHVRNSMSKLRTETERQLRSYTIGKLYYKQQEFAVAEQYLNSYLNAKDDNDHAYKLLGLCYIQLKKPDKAIEAFQRSLQLNPKQPDVVGEICKLILDDKNFNPNTAKYWCDRAEKEAIKHDAALALRIKLSNQGNMPGSQMEDMLQKEITSRPNDVQLRVCLIKSYIEQQKILDAYNYVSNWAMNLNESYYNSSEWYNIVSLVLSKYEHVPNAKKGWEYWRLLIICLERQVLLSFAIGAASGTNAVGETTNLLFSFDQCLFKLTQVVDKLCAQRELVELFLQHFRGQLLLHAATLIFKRELAQNRNNWEESVRHALPLLLLAYHTEVVDDKTQWIKHCDEQSKLLIQLWQREGAFRCAQAGHTLLSCIADTDKDNVAHQVNTIIGNQTIPWRNVEELLAQIRQTCSDKQWRRSTFMFLFCKGDQKLKEQSSLLAKCPKFAEPAFELPARAEIESYEETAQYLRPQSLQHLVYLSLSVEKLSTVRVKYFSGLNFSTQNLSFCGAESLNQLDVESFLYAATIQTKRMLAVEREAYENYNSGNRSAAGKPRILPFALMQGQLCTDEQAAWWTAAYTTYKNVSVDNVAEQRSVLQYGIEAVRGINGPKCDMIIVFKLGQLLVLRAEQLVKPIEKSFLEARAESLYKCGLNMIKMNDKKVLEPFRKYFKYAKVFAIDVEQQLAAIAEEAVSYLARRYFKNAAYEELIEELEGVQLPFASYFTAESYRKMNDSHKTARNTKKMYAERISECLQQTMSLLNRSKTDRNHPLHSVIPAELKRLQHTTGRNLSEVYNSPRSLNNSSAYEDAEEEYFTPSLTSRSRHENSMAESNARYNAELEKMVKQMVTTLSIVKDEIIEEIKPEVHSMRKEITSLKEKIAHMEETMKKPRRHSNAPSRDDGSNVLDDLYMIEDLQNQLYQNTPTHLQGGNNMYPTVSSGPPGGVPSPFVQTQQRIHTPNPLQMQQNAAAVAAAYNSPIFGPNYAMNYYTPPYMMGPQATGPGALLGARNPLSMPFMDGGAMNFGMQPPNPLLPPPNPLLPPPAANQDGRPSSLYGLLNQAPSAGPPLPQLTLPMSLSSLMPAQPPVATISAAPGPPPIQFNKALNNQPVEKGPPANVVITTSDPLPNPNAPLQTQQPTLSVTIPSHHIKPSLVQTPETNGAAANNSGFSGFGSGSSFSGFGGNTTSNNSINTLFGSRTLAASTASSISTSFNSSTFSFKPQIEEAAKSSASFEEAGNESVEDEHHAEHEPEYDPRPDFQPIIPLPDEVAVKTGEEDEEVMFCHRAKLFRHVDSEWKERGIGDIKILKGKDGFSRVLMRRDQIHKICANHRITGLMKLAVPKNEKKGFIWSAPDFADEEITTQQFFVRFKLPETAQAFHDAFTKASQEAKELEKASTKMPPPAATEKTDKVSVPPFQLAKSGATGFATSTPCPKPDSVATVTSTTSSVAASTVTTTTSVSKTLFGLPVKSAAKPEPPAQVSPFANFSFDKSSSQATSTPATSSASPFANIFSNIGKASESPFSVSKLQGFQPATVLPAAATEAATPNKSNSSDGEEEYVSTAQFNPVIPLPDLIEVSTGEENEEVLFEHRAKLLRFVKETSEWKERGLGNIKLLRDRDDVNKVRLVMRREQVHKLCCNQRIQKNTVFKYAKNSQTALTWVGQDFSESELVTETLTIRFKTPETCKQFLEAILKVQADMSDENSDENASDKKEAVSKTTKEPKEANALPAKSFGDAFKPKAGAWSCQFCYVSNTAENLHCLACDQPKDDTVPKKEAQNLLAAPVKSAFSFGFANAGAADAATHKSGETGTANAGFSFGNATTSDKPTFSFGLAKSTAPTAATTATPALVSSTTKTNGVPTGFGEQFKPKAGSWSCRSCYLSNSGDQDYCMACGDPKDDTVPKKPESTNSAVLATTQKFSFGFAPQAAADANKTAQAEPLNFSFGGGTQKPGQDGKTFPFSAPTATSTTVGALGKPSFSFTMPGKAGTEAVTPPTSESAPSYSIDKKDFCFTLKPKSPGKGNKPLGGGDADVDADDAEGGDGDYHEEEENNTYFTPVIPLPEKIDVKTGEENEEVLYVHRAKLYRYIEGEWKERGLGDLKILRHKETKKLRIVMRREKILKICLNHVLNPDVEYKPKDEKSWLFVVNDFSEGAVELSQCSLRFKNKEVAQGFMDAVKKALDGTAEPVIDVVAASDGANVSEISSVSGAPSAADDKAKTEELKLPEDFFGNGPDKLNSEAENATQANDLPLEMPALPAATPTAVLKQSALTPVAAAKISATTLENNKAAAQPQSLFPAFTAAAATASPFGANANASPFALNSNASSFAPSPFTAANTTVKANADSSEAADTTASNFSFAATFNDINKQPATKTAFLFGESSQDKDKLPLFGASIFNSSRPTPPSEDTNSSDSKPTIFGGKSTGTTAPMSTGSIFGGQSVFGSQPVFGGKPAFGSQPVFGGKPAFGSNPTFGSSPITFGATAIKSDNGPTDAPKSIFGGSSIFGGAAPATNTGNSLFGGSSSFAGFGTKAAAESPSLLTVSPAANAVPVPDFADLSTKSGVVDFASLATKTPAVTKPEKPASGGFIGLTNQDAFSSFLKPATKTTLDSSRGSEARNSGDEDEQAATDDNYDPHYEPVIELPKEISLSTGEEEEVKLFGERGTLFRWHQGTNTKEWKERGVGEVKVLKHPEHGTYRLLLRREQIHKLVLNHAIGSDFIFKNFNNNPKSFSWACMNYAEDKDGVMEKLAVRFKKVEIAEQFAKVVNECIEAAKKREADTNKN